MKNKSRIFYWCLYDFANSSYAVIIVAFVYAVYFTNVIADRQPIGDFYWSLGINISMIISAILNPLCGAIADYTSDKKKFLIFFSLLSIIATMLMYFTGSGTIALGILLFILSNIGFQTALTFYDTFLTEITEPKNFDTVSGYGYSLGYLGSLISVLLVFPLAEKQNILFVITGIFFLIFSLPLFFLVKEKRRFISDTSPSFSKQIKFGFIRIVDTIRHISDYKNLTRYLIAYFLYIDAVNTIIFFAGIYASKTLNFDMIQLAIFFLIVQFTAMFGSLIFGFIGKKAGTKNSILSTLIIWTIIVFYIFLFIHPDSVVTIMGYTFHQFFIIGGFAGLFLGATQSLSRSLMAKLTPEEIKTEFFGFYALFEKTSTLLGPLTFGLVSWLTASQNLAILSVGIFFILGILVLRPVRES